MTRARNAVGIVALSLVIGSTPAAFGQESAGDLGRWTVLVPSPGAAAELEEGYRRHLEWHRENRDPWTWYGWTVVMGDRPGTFVDATLGHSAEALNSPVRPTEDAADNRENVFPHLASAETYLIRFRGNLSPGIGDPTSVPLLQAFEYRLEPAGFAEFVRILASLASNRSSPARPHGWYEFVSGGEHPRMLLLIPARKLSELDLSGPSPLPEIVWAGLDGETSRRLAAAIRSIRSEVLRYRPDLTYLGPAEDGEAEP